MTAATPPRPIRRGNMVLTITGLIALLSVTGAATPKSVAKLQALGLGQLDAQILLHVAPVVVGAVAAFVAQTLAAGRSTIVRFGIFAGLGLLTGFMLGYCLDLFAGAGALLDAVFGPSQMRDEHVVGWTMTILCCAWALIMTALAVFGTPAARALQEANGDPECAEVRPRDRAIFREAAVGMAASGVSTGALTILAQTGASGTSGAVLAAVSALGCIVSTWASWVLWKRSDELQQRAVLLAYTGSALVLTFAAFAWAIAESLGFSITLTPYALYLAFTIVQFVAAAISQVVTQGYDAPNPRSRAA